MYLPLHTYKITTCFWYRTSVVIFIFIFGSYSSRGHFRVVAHPITAITKHAANQLKCHRSLRLSSLCPGSEVRQSETRCSIKMCSPWPHSPTVIRLGKHDLRRGSLLSGCEGEQTAAMGADECVEYQTGEGGHLRSRVLLWMAGSKQRRQD